MFPETFKFVGARTRSLFEHEKSISSYIYIAFKSAVENCFFLCRDVAFCGAFPGVHQE